MTATGFHDRYGLPLSTASAAAADHYTRGIDSLFAFDTGTEDLLQAAVTADPGFALGHIALGAFYQGQRRGEDARTAAAQARELAAGTTTREQRHIAALSAAITGDSTGAMGLIREQLAEFPRDALLLSQAQNLIGFSGAMDREAQRFAILDQMAPHYGDDWWFLSTYSFVHHELQRFEEARRLSQRSLELNPRNAAASHNIAHVYFETEDHPGGVAFLSPWLADYSQEAPFHCHLSWHLALFELHRGHYGPVMELYERAISPAVAQMRFSLFDGAALLWRQELYQCASGPLPWQEICTVADQMTARPGAAFADVHAALAYAAAHDEAALNRLIDGLRDLDAKGHTLAGPVVLPVVHGVAAFARGEYTDAIRHLTPIADQFHRIGGSHAQWEILEQTLAEALLRAGEFEQAEALIRRRLKRRESPRDLFWLGRAQAGAGAPTAVATLDQARARWADADAGSPELAVLNRLRGAA